MIDYPKLARKLERLGYEPIPIKPGEKYPTMKDWQNMQLPVKWPSPHHGIGLRTGGGLIGFDLDIYHEKIVSQVVALTEFFCCPPEGVTRIGQLPKVLIPLLSKDFPTKETSSKWIDSDGVINQIEILSGGQQFVAYGVHPGTEKPYEWSGDLPKTKLLPVITRDQVEDIFAQFDELAEKHGWSNQTKIDQQAKQQVAHLVNRRKKTTVETGDAPGDIYNRSVTIETVLEHYGWTSYQGQYWTRPGKRRGISASVFGDIAYCFTSSTCLDERGCHDAFEVLARYEFSGDKSACARALREQILEVSV